jgi:Ca-activated chloride channel family protein
MRVGMAGPRTAFGDAIGLAINPFAKSTAKAKTIIALTDGNDTGSRAPPQEAAAVAHDDEDTLKAVADTTGGGFYRAMDRTRLEEIYARLDAIETRKIDTVTFRPKREIYWIPLAGAIGLSMAGEAAGFLAGLLRARAGRRFKGSRAAPSRAAS